MRELNWREAFSRLRLVLYAIAAILTAIAVYANMPTTTQGFRDCANDVRQHVRDRYARSVDVYPPGLNDEQFCKAVAGGQVWYVEALDAKGVAMRRLASASRESLLMERAVGVGAAAFYLLLGIAIAEALSRALVWTLAGLFAQRPTS